MNRRKQRGAALLTEQVISGFEDALVGMKPTRPRRSRSHWKKPRKVGRYPTAGKTLKFEPLVTSIKRP